MGGEAEAVGANQVTKRKLGRTHGTKWKKVRGQKKGPVKVDIPACLRRAVGENAQQFITETSYMVKQYLPVNVLKWYDIDKDVREKLMNKIKEMYVLPNETYVDKAIRTMLQKRYTDWRYHLKKHSEKFNTVKERLANSPAEIDPNDWKWLVVEFWGSAKQKRISEVNAENRKKQLLQPCCGTKSFVRMLHELRNANDEEEGAPEYMKLFLKERKQKNGEWVTNAEAEYKKLQELHDSQVKEFGADNLTIVEAYTRVFGHRSGYVRGLGEGPPPLKSVKECGSTNISEADLNARIQAGVEQQVREICKKKEEEMEKRLQEIT